MQENTSVAEQLLFTQEGSFPQTFIDECRFSYSLALSNPDPWKYEVSFKTLPISTILPTFLWIKTTWQ
jgi:hypothetical protein